jgi:hypothetical protein
MTSTSASQSLRSSIHSLLDAGEAGEWIPFGRDADMLFVIQTWPVQNGCFDDESR